MKLHTNTWPIESSAFQSRTEALVLLHGMGGVGTLWRPLAAKLESDFAVISMDQRGHGKSQEVPNSDYSPLAYGQDVVDTLEALHIEKAWILGHSMGVRTACAFAHLKPESTKGLILVDLGFYGPGGGGVGENLRFLLERMPIQFESREKARAYFEEHSPDPSISQYLMAVSIPGSEQGSLTFPFNRQALLDTLNAVQDFSLREWIEELVKRKTPILALRGETSRVWKKEDYEEEKKRFAPYSSIQFQEIKGTGHGLPFEKRLEFIQVIKTFIEKSKS